MPASIETVRSHFPALQRKHNGHAVAYFDGPGGTQVPQQVIDAVANYLANHNANTHWGYLTSNETDTIIADARQAAADFLNAAPDEICFGPNMTSLTFHVSRTLGRQWGPEDAVVVTELDHHANVDPWRALERERGVTVLTARMIPETGQLDWDHLEHLMSDRTRLLAIGAASNALGTINDVARACRLAHAVGAYSYVDAVHFAPHELVDVNEFDCDFLACSAYKFYGPHMGLLYARKHLLESLDFPKLQPAPDHAPVRAETGTQNHEGIAGVCAAIDFLASLTDEGETRRERLICVYQTLKERGKAQLRRLWEGLDAIDGITVYEPGPDEHRTPTLSLSVEGIPAAEVSRRLAETGLLLSHGDYYASTAIERLGKSDEGLVRVGCACYTSNDEVERVIEGVRGLA
ncbi:MAG: cysteine desulfurase-like protein [Planctomycetota bacterium]|nr:cysteine desulfurase-like protein [Planctomycetota bacterium]